MAPHTRFLTVPAQTRLRNWAATRRARRKHAKNLRGRPEPEARSPHPVEPDRQSRTPDPNHHQEGPPTSLRLRDQPRPRSDQQRLRAGAAPQRGLPQDHQWLSKRVGSQALRRHSLRRRNRTTTLDPRHRRHPPNPPSKTNPSPRLNQPTARVSNYECRLPKEQGFRGATKATIIRSRESVTQILKGERGRRSSKRGV